jgi:hypothetical protein
MCACLEKRLAVERSAVSAEHRLFAMSRAGELRLPQSPKLTLNKREDPLVN